MAKDFEFTINAGCARAADFMEVFGRLTVCVKSPIPEWARLPGMPEPVLVFMLDMAEITWQEHERLVKFLAGRFGMTLVEAENRLEAEGIPIVAADGVLTVENPQRWLMDDPVELWDGRDDEYDYGYEDDMG